MYQLVFNSRHGRTELHNNATGVQVVNLEIVSLGGPPGLATAKNIVTRRINKFNRGTISTSPSSQFSKLHDLIRKRIPEYLFDGYHNNPWHKQTLREALLACKPVCANPNCPPCAVFCGITGKGANTAIDAYGWIQRPRRRWNIGYESETSHINSAMWSILRLNHANKGLYVNNPGKRGVTRSSVALVRASSLPPDAASLDLGIVAMWRDKRGGGKTYQPSKPWWLRTRSFHPSPLMPAIAVFVSLT